MPVLSQTPAKSIKSSNNMVIRQYHEWSQSQWSSYLLGCGCRFGRYIFNAIMGITFGRECFFWHQFGNDFPATMDKPIESSDRSEALIEVFELRWRLEDPPGRRIIEGCGHRWKLYKWGTHGLISIQSSKQVPIAEGNPTTYALVWSGWRCNWISIITALVVWVVNDALGKVLIGWVSSGLANRYLGLKHNKNAPNDQDGARLKRNSSMSNNPNKSPRTDLWNPYPSPGSLVEWPNCATVVANYHQKVMR